MRFLLRFLRLLSPPFAILPFSTAQSKPAPYVYTGQPSIDIAKVAFSRYGSYIAFSELTKDNLARFGNTGFPAGLYLRSVHGDQHTVLRLELLDGGIPLPFQVKASPSLLRLKAASQLLVTPIRPLDGEVHVMGDPRPSVYGCSVDWHLEPPRCGYLFPRCGKPCRG